MKQLSNLICAMIVSFSSVFALNTSQDEASGDTVSAWQGGGALGYDIYVSTQTGGSWTSPAAIGDIATNPQTPLTAINSSGLMVVIWSGTDQTTFNQALYGSFYVSGSWVTTQLSDATNEYLLGDYQVKISVTGSVIVTWLAYDYTLNNNVVKAIYCPTYGTWGTPVTVQ